MGCRHVHLGSGLHFPISVVTESLAILAMKRVGKSYTARKVAESLLKANQQVVIIDPKGDWWGIRSSSDGKGPGYPVVILGGNHGDVPLEVGGGELVARLAVEQQVNVLLDVSSLRKNEVATFMTAFLETLYRLKSKEEYRTPMMLIVDEADAIAPQKPFENERRMLGAMEDIVRRGGQRGLGIMLITQRTAVLNKNVLTQCGILIFLRMMGAQDIDAIDDWVNKHGQPEQRAQLLSVIASLPRGRIWFWAPAWPDDAGIFKSVDVEPIETFDSGATPKPGERRTMPKMLADVDLDTFRTEMAQTIERAKAEDPRELRKRITELANELNLARKLNQTQSVTTAKASRQEDAQTIRQQSATIRTLKQALETAMKFIITVSAKKFDVPGVNKAELEKAVKAAVERATQLVDARLQTREHELQRLREQATRLIDTLKKVVETPTIELAVEVSKNEPFTVGTKPASPPPRPKAPRTADQPAGELGKCERTLLAVLLQRPQGCSFRQLLVLAVYRNSGGTRNALATLRSQGLIVGQNSGVMQATDLAQERYGKDVEALPTGEALRTYWLQHPSFGLCERKILEALIGAYPKGLTRDAILQQTNYEWSGGTRNALACLRTSGVITGQNSGEMKAADHLFEE